MIYEVDLASGSTAPLATIPGNYDLAFDVTPGLAYVASNIFDADFGAGVVLSPNEIHRIDLATGATELVASYTGFSGPLSVNEFGDLFAGQFPETFSFPPDSIRALLFDDASLDSGSFKLMWTRPSSSINSTDSPRWSTTPGRASSSSRRPTPARVAKTR